MLFLIAEPKYVSCVRLAYILESCCHDSVNRFLLREQFTPQDLFEQIRGDMILEGGTISIDDSVIDKPYSDINKTELIGYFWSGKHKCTVKGINLITLYCTDILGQSYPVNFRIYDKQDGKTKNEYFLEMLVEVKGWGLKPAWITGDSWYSSIENLKFLRKEEVSFLFGIAENRKVSLTQGQEVQVKTLEIPKDGLMAYLRGFGWVKIFCQDFKNEVRHYILWTSNIEENRELTHQTFKKIHDQHWLIEGFHRVIKQVCNIERFQIRAEQGIRNHFFCALSAFIKLQHMRIEGMIESVYQISRELFVPVIRQFIRENLAKPSSAVTAYSTSAVNA
jgi:hypothetical protein